MYNNVKHDLFTCYIISLTMKKDSSLSTVIKLMSGQLNVWSHLFLLSRRAFLWQSIVLAAQKVVGSILREHCTEMH